MSEEKTDETVEPPHNAPMIKDDPGAKPSSGAVCCCATPRAPGRGGSYKEKPHWVEGSVQTVVGDVPQVSTKLQFRDHLGAFVKRCAIRRMRYRVKPGLYVVGNPGPESLVFVSANYKMSFDRLRSELGGLDAWIMVLDTKGINVWCAAGKGTFGTDELVNRLEQTRLPEIVSQRKLIVPQLGATGVCGHEVKRRTGFSVVFGPVRADDIPAFLEAGMTATPEMRRVRFALRDRLVVVPTELMIFAKFVILIAVIRFLVAGFGPGLFSIDRALSIGLGSTMLKYGAFLAALAITPILLPWLPGRAFALKGAWVGLAVALVVNGYELVLPGLFDSWLTGVALLFLIPAAVSFCAMLFTGASTYTSFSGVRREMRMAVPLQFAAAFLGTALLAVEGFV